MIHFDTGDCYAQIELKNSIADDINSNQADYVFE